MQISWRQRGLLVSVLLSHSIIVLEEPGVPSRHGFPAQPPHRHGGARGLPCRAKLIVIQHCCWGAMAAQRGVCRPADTAHTAHGGNSYGKAKMWAGWVGNVMPGPNSLLHIPKPSRSVVSRDQGMRCTRLRAAPTVSWHQTEQTSHCSSKMTPRGAFPKAGGYKTPCSITTSLNHPPPSAPRSALISVGAKNTKHVNKGSHMGSKVGAGTRHLRAMLRIQGMGTAPLCSCHQHPAAHRAPCGHSQTSQKRHTNP